MGRPSDKFELIHEILQDPENTFTVKQLCELNHVSRSGYYSWFHSLEAKAAKEAQDRADFDLILQAFHKHGRKKESDKSIWSFSTWILLLLSI